MAWRGRQTALKCNTVAEFVSYLHTLNFSNWRPSGIVQHNTASPTLEQWWHGGTSPEQRMRNLKAYYQSLGWSAGPHAFVDGVSIWVMTDFNVKGVHSPSWNGTRLGIEMVGDYDKEDDETGPGKKVLDLTTALFGECCSFFGWEPNNSIIKQHKEDPNTTHACPGKKVVKSEFVADVSQYMSDGGEHPPQPPERLPPRQGTVVGLASGDELNIRASSSSSAPIIGTAVNGDIMMVVGEAMNGSTKWYRLEFGEEEGTAVAIYGWASAKYIQVAGVTPPAVTWRENITATVFGGPGDEQPTAYGGYVNSSTRGVSFPYKWRNTARPSVVVVGPKGEYTTGIVDVGPWNIDDPNYVLNGARPLAEKQYQERTQAQNGQVPSNDAGIDLTVPVAAAIGVSGKGKVKWRFADPPGPAMV
jgi:hypothetical protein